MSLRAYFDIALDKGDTKESAEKRRAALDLTVTTGEEALLHLQQAQDSRKKLRAHQEQLRRKVHA
jgi:hypothetical protein